MYRLQREPVELGSQVPEMLHFLKRWLTFVILELRRLRQEDCYE